MAIAATPAGGISSEYIDKIDSALQPENLPSEDLDVGNAVLTGTELDVTGLDIANLTLTANTTITSVVGLKVGGVILNITPAGFTLAWASSLINPLNISGDAFDPSEEMTASILCTSVSPVRFKINYDANYAPVVAPPGAPSGLTATASSGQIALAWTDNSTTETGFLIERSDDNETFTLLDEVDANIEAFVDETVNDETQYWYRVRAFDGSQYSSYSNVANATTPAPALQTIVINIGSAVAGYNNLSTINAGTSLLNVNDSTGAATTYDLEIVAAFDAIIASPNATTYDATGDETVAVRDTAFSQSNESVWAGVVFKTGTPGDVWKVEVISGHTNSAAKADFRVNGGATQLIDSYNNGFYNDLGNATTDANGDILLELKNPVGQSPNSYLQAVRFSKIS